MADNANTGSVVTDAVTGLAEGLNEASALQADVDKKKAEAAKAESTERSAMDSYVENISKLGSTVRQYKQTADSAKVTAREHEMIRSVQQAVSSGGAVSISDVLELMDAEKAAKAKAKEESSRYAKVAMHYAGEAVFTGAGVLLDGFASGASDSMKSAKGLIALAGGTAAGLVLNDGAMQNFVADAVDNYAQLKAEGELDEGVEEKTVDGLEDEAAMADYAAENQNGVPSDPYGSQTAGFGEEYEGKAKEFAKAGERQDISKSDDALSAPAGSVNLDEIMNKVLDGTADPGTTGKTEPQAGGLLASIAESDLVQAVAATAADKLVPERSALAQKVIDMAEQSDLESGPEESGIAAPDLTQFA